MSAKDLLQRVDVDCIRLIEHYRTIISRSQILDGSIQPNQQLQLEVASEGIVSYSHFKIDHLTSPSPHAVSF